MNSTEESKSASQVLKDKYIGVKLSFNWIPTERRFSEGQKAAAAEIFEAHPGMIKAKKLLFNTRNEAYTLILSYRNDISRLWKLDTIDYPQPGVRLINKNKVQNFNEMMEGIRPHFDEAVNSMQEQWEQIKGEAHSKLNSLYSEADYPTNIKDIFGFKWEFVELAPPQALANIDEKLYQDQMKVFEGELTKASDKAFSLIMTSVVDLTEHILEKLKGDQVKKLRKTSIEGLQEVIKTFYELHDALPGDQNITDQMERLNKLTKNLTAKQLKDMSELREAVKKNMEEIGENIKTELKKKERIVK